MEVISTRDYKKYSYSFVFADDEASKVVSIDPNLGIKGEVVKLVAVVPNWTNDVTAVIKAINEDSKEIFASSSLTRNEEYDLTLIVDECIIVGDSGEQWEVELSGVPGGSGGTFVLTAYVKG